ncbi:MAG TPA: amino acid permease, partial [Thermoanaerobaculia bacterium]|nr:amino acid permease [Thermoanaerobaculia bacterium]
MSLVNAILGRRLANWQAEGEKIGLLAGIPILGLDGLSSAAYGPEAALTILIPLGALGLAYVTPITFVILGLLAILYFSYRQTIAAYPNGGGSYVVAKENLGTPAGLLAAAALMLDYILNVAVGISAGIGALVSAVPALHPHILGLCLLTLVIITIINLRGVRESGWAFGLPTYLFVGCLFVVLIVG